MSGLPAKFQPVCATKLTAELVFIGENGSRQDLRTFCKAAHYHPVSNK